jgi:hypothetical protein
MITERFGGIKRACLLCVEAEANLCHRSLLAAALAKVGNTKVKHL